MGSSAATSWLGLPCGQGLCAAQHRAAGQAACAAQAGLPAA